MIAVRLPYRVIHSLLVVSRLYLLDHPQVVFSRGGQAVIVGHFVLVHGWMRFGWVEWESNEAEGMDAHSFG